MKNFPFMIRYSHNFNCSFYIFTLYASTNEQLKHSSANWFTILVFWFAIFEKCWFAVFGSPKIGSPKYWFVIYPNRFAKSLNSLLAPIPLYVTIAMIGMNPVFWTLNEELFRGFGSSFMTVLSYADSFVAVKVSPALFVTLGEQGVYLTCGICCFIGTIFILIFRTETQGRTLKVVAALFWIYTICTIYTIQYNNCTGTIVNNWLMYLIDNTL